jgi:phosphatidylglycerol---prolipoprotein diacylglyceryl transferase
MSFHGGFLGVIIALFLCSKLYTHLRFFFVTDILAVIIPVALGLGRI